MSITASEARQNLFPLIEQANEDHAPVHITSRKGNTVLMSEEDFGSWAEKDRKMVKRINKLIDDTHRLVYRPTDDELIIVQARYRY